MLCSTWRVSAQGQAEGMGAGCDEDFISWVQGCAASALQALGVDQRSCAEATGCPHGSIGRDIDFCAGWLAVEICTSVCRCAHRYAAACISIVTGHIPSLLLQIRGCMSFQIV